MKSTYRVQYGDYGSFQDFTNWKEASAFAKYCVLSGYKVVLTHRMPSGGAA